MTDGAGRKPVGAPTAVDVFDTTLRDGAQFEGISLTVEDKLRVAAQLDWLGVRWIEGGYPQANPRDAEFFARAPAELEVTDADGRRSAGGAVNGGGPVVSLNVQRGTLTVRKGGGT